MITHPKRKNIIPGFGLSLGFSLVYLSLVVLLPLSALLLKTSELTPSQFWTVITSARVLASYKTSFGIAIAATFISAFFGLIVAWVLVRYQFPCRKLLDALVDLPFALPTAIAGISLTAVYAENGWIGQYLHLLGIKVTFTPLGIMVALVFVGFPFVVRTLQPVILDLDQEIEEAAASLGANRIQTLRYVIFPHLRPALLSGSALALARTIGEYGSVIFISGNLPMRTEITPLLIVTKLEQYDYAGATALATVMLAISFLLLLGINFIQWRSKENLA